MTLKKQTLSNFLL